MAEEWRVEIELGDEGHGPTLGERLRSLDLDNEARERLGGRVVVTRDGAHMFLYARSEEAAREARRVVDELLAADGLEARVEVARWDPDEHEWEDPETGDEVGPLEEHDQPPTPHPVFVFIGAHKPRFLRDLGL